MIESKNTPARFIAFELPRSVTEWITTVQEAQRRPIHMKPLPPHITLITPPMLQGVELKGVVSDLRRFLSGAAVIEAHMENVRTFPSGIAYALIQSEPLMVFQQSMMNALGFKAYEPTGAGKTQYVPHVTLLQTKSRGDLSEDTLQGLQSMLQPETMTLSQISLYEHIGSREYKIIESFKLKG